MPDTLQQEYAGLAKRIKDTKAGDARNDMIAQKGEISRKLDKQLGRKKFKAFVSDVNQG